MRRAAPPILSVRLVEHAALDVHPDGNLIVTIQGYPLRLLLPGWEGNTNVKWLHSLKLTDQPYMARDETSKYSDLMPDGKARIFTYRMEAKSVITFPSGGQTLPGNGLYGLTGLAWSGSGRIDRVEITTDGGKSWVDAQLQEPRRVQCGEQLEHAPGDGLIRVDLREITAAAFGGLLHDHYSSTYLYKCQLVE